MTTRFPLAAAIAAILALQPVALATLSAAEPGQAAAGTKPSAEPDKAKKICRAETPTGSIRPVRTCHTREEWEAQAAQGQANKEQLNQDLLRRQTISGSRG